MQPRLDANYVVFYCIDTDSDGTNYYESLDSVDANHPQTILAYEMNDRALPIEHGARFASASRPNLGTNTPNTYKRSNSLRI